MDSFEFNKIAGALLGAALLLMIIGKVSDALVHPHMPEKAHIAVTDEAPAAPSASGEAPKPPPLAEGGVADAGKAVFQKVCFTCHTADKGGAVKQGPNLFGVVGRKAGTVAGFQYSKCVGEKPEWSDETLNSFLWKPSADCKGTKMAMAGLKDKDRADIIAFLKSLK